MGLTRNSHKGEPVDGPLMIEKEAESDRVIAPVSYTHLIKFFPQIASFHDTAKKAPIKNIRRITP